MGVLCKVVDGILLLTFLTVSVVATSLDTQTFLPESLFPDVLIRLYKWYSTTTRDYLLQEKPLFFVALMILEVFFLVPLALLNIYGMLTSKSWFSSTCLIFGSCLLTSAVPSIGDMAQKPGSDIMVKLYSPFAVVGILAMLRGLVPQQGKASSTIGNGPLLVKKTA